MIRRFSASMLLLVLCLFGQTAIAIDAGPAFEEPELQARYQRLISEVRCLTCQNQTIKDSNSLLAEDLRREVREQMAAGKSDTEIFDFLTERYGDFALYKTPFNERTWLIWVLPPIAIAFCIGLFFRIVRKRSAMPLDDNGWDEE